MILLDTDTLSLLMRHHPGLAKRIAASEPAAITVISRLEILRGRIASIALAHRATLVTRNRKHFQQVAGLQVENWADSP